MDFAIGSWQAEDQFMPDWAGQLRSDMNLCWEMCRSVKASFEPPKIYLIGIKLNKFNSYLVLERKKIIEEYLRGKKTVWREEIAALRFILVRRFFASLMGS